jgi:hypothetical protein
MEGENMSNEQELIKVTSTSTIYLNLFDQYWPIADMPTVAGVFGSSPAVTTVPSLPAGAQMGPAIAAGSGLWQPQGSPNVYFVCTGNKPITAYWITSPEALSYYQFNGPTQTCTNQVINDWLGTLITQGQKIDMPS